MSLISLEAFVISCLGLLRTTVGRHCKYSEKGNVIQFHMCIYLIRMWTPRSTSSILHKRLPFLFSETNRKISRQSQCKRICTCIIIRNIRLEAKKEYLKYIHLRFGSLYNFHSRFNKSNSLIITRPCYSYSWNIFPANYVQLHYLRYTVSQYCTVLSEKNVRDSENL